MDVTPKMRLIANANILWFDSIKPLQQFVFQKSIDQHIGEDLSLGLEFRPLLNNNVIVLCGAAVFCPANGFRQLYNRFREARGSLG